MPVTRQRTTKPKRRFPARRRTAYVKKRSSRYAKSRNTKRANLIGRVSRTVQRGYLPFGQEYWARLPWGITHFVAADSSTGKANVQDEYLLSGMYDPQTSTSASVTQWQANGWDQLSAVYERYWVHATKFTITFTNPSSDGMFVGYRIRASTDAYSADEKTYDQLATLPNTAIRWINDSGRQTLSMSGFIRHHQIMGVTKAQYGNLEYSAQTSSNPTVTPVLEIFAGATAGSGTQTIRYTVQATFYIQYSNRQGTIDTGYIS